MAEVHVGCCGFPISRESYYTAFKAVEIQQTFYQPPMLGTATKWSQEAPKDFLFTLKAWQLITHDPKSPTYRRLKFQIEPRNKKNYGFFRPSDEVFAAWEVTRAFALELKARMVVFQSPASFTPEKQHKENMVRFFAGLERGGLPLVWEPRGKWEVGEIKELCQRLDLIHCVDPLKSEPSYGRLRYFRLHGPAGYRSHYQDHDLSRILGMCQGDIYCFFNNSFMFEDATRFLRLLQRRQKR